MSTEPRTANLTISQLDLRNLGHAVRLTMGKQARIFILAEFTHNGDDTATLVSSAGTEMKLPSSQRIEVRPTALDRMVFNILQEI